MTRTWERPLPLEMVCPDCRKPLPKGTRYHRCEGATLDDADYTHMISLRYAR